MEPDKVFSLSEFVRFVFKWNSLKSLWAPIFWLTVPINEKVCAPALVKGSNSSKSPIGMNDLDLYKRIWFLLAKTSTK